MSRVRVIKNTRSPDLYDYDEEQISLNLNRGRERFRHGQEISRHIIPDVERYFEVAARLTRKISRDYKHLFQGCFIKGILMLDLANMKATARGIVDPTHSKRMEVFKSLNACLEQKVDLVAIAVGIMRADHRFNHMNMLIVNNIAHTIELYDPNGWKWHQEEYGSTVVKMIAGVFKNLDNKFLSIKETNPSIGFQQFQKPNRRYFNEGLCTYWSLYIAHLRAEHYEMSAREFTRKVTLRIKTLYKEAYNMAGNTDENLANYFANYILEYVADDDDELDPSGHIWSEMFQ